MAQPRSNEGYCRCGGGNGSCAGCDVKLIIKTFKRQPGLDGKKEAKGTSITKPLAAGRNGQEGSASIAVNHEDGSTQVYHSIWSLELVDFEVEDENGDGIFEPGEHIFIRRIKVRNVGGMPSPICRIPVTLLNNSLWFEPVSTTEGGLTYLPINIPAGETASTDGSIKVRIKDRSRANSRPASLNTRFTAKVAQGAISKVQYKVMNTSIRPLGEQATVGRARAIEVRASIPQEFRRLGTDDDNVENILSIPYIRPKDSVSTEHTVLATSKDFMQKTKSGTRQSVPETGLLKKLHS
ncbi:hypothetical protein N0V90_005329 [Kalmusia sp. IMI 367209]|nr:hypothetical protein N0V90_005329 [Kalmusia sp. IMI 367209]